MIDQLFRFIDPNIKLSIDDIPEKRLALLGILLARYVVSTKPELLTYTINNNNILNGDDLLFHLDDEGWINSTSCNLYLDNYSFEDGEVIISIPDPLWNVYHLTDINTVIGLPDEVPLLDNVPIENGTAYDTIGGRQTMEDAYTYVRMDNVKISLVADGHGGHNTSTYVANTLPSKILCAFRDERGEETRDEFIKRVITQSYLEMDSVICNKYTDGSTCILSLLIDRDFYFVNLGDSRGILIDLDERKIVLNTRDHKPTDIEEYTRIVGLGGTIFGGRVFGSLALTRAFGDVSFKRGPRSAESHATHETDAKTKDSRYMGFNAYVSPKPDIYKYTLVDHKYVYVIACDGVWDVLSNDNVLDYILDQDGDYNSKALVELASNIGSRDNITAMIVNL